MTSGTRATLLRAARELRDLLREIRLSHDLAGMTGAPGTPAWEFWHDGAFDRPTLDAKLAAFIEALRDEALVL